MPDVGIVLPVYRQRKDYLRAAIRSIRKQLYRNFRFVIVIDGITPEVQQVVRRETRRDKRIHVIAYAQNRGTEHALNVGFNYLNGFPAIRYLTWVSSDNIYHRNFIKVLRRNLRFSPDHVGLVYSNMKLIQSGGQFLSYTISWQNQPKEKLLDYNFIYGSFMYKKKYAAKAGQYEHTPVEDYDYWLKLTEHCSLKYVPRALVTYRMFAPLSNSLKIKNDPASFRYNRYKIQLIKHLARMRRGIAPETSIIYAVNGTSEAMANRLEELLNQSYTNFRIYLIDTSLDGSAASITSVIPDPRIDYVSIPSAADQVIYQAAANYAITPFILFFTTEGEKLGAGYLDQMAANLRAMPYVPSAASIVSNQLYMSAALLS